MRERQSLMNAKTMLLIDYGKAKFFKFDRLLKKCVSANGECG